MLSINYIIQFTYMCMYMYNVCTVLKIQYMYVQSIHCTYYITHLQVSETLLPSTILPQYIPRVYPFLSHTISTVRSSSLSAIMNLVATRAQRGEAGETCTWIQELLEGLVCQVFQRLAVEGDEAIRTMCLEVLTSIIIIIVCGRAEQ